MTRPWPRTLGIGAALAVAYILSARLGFRVVFAAAAVAIWNTIAGSGPFAGDEPHESLVLLQVFMGIAAGTGLLVAAAVAERETSQRWQAAAHAASQVLAGAPSLSDAATDIVKGVCQNLDWSHGVVWIVDEGARCLTCFTVWPSSSPFADATRARTCAAGEGLPGRVWQSGQPTWIEDITGEAIFRAPQPRGSQGSTAPSPSRSVRAATCTACWSSSTVPSSRPTTICWRR